MNIALVSDKTIQFHFEGCQITQVPADAVVTPSDWLRFDAAFLVSPVSESEVAQWIGHPHLRYLVSKAALKEEVAYLLRHTECEKKLLVHMPSPGAIDKYRPFVAEIEQVYLSDSTASHRIRKRKMGSAVSFTETLKYRITNATARETERSITSAEYNALLQQADPALHPINKKRYCFFYQHNYFELDVYSFWSECATLELELKSEDEDFELPPELTLIRDVTDDKRYKNHYLAGIAYEDYNTGIL